MPDLKFTPFPMLLTERLVLRQAVAADAPDLFAIRSDEEVNRYLDRTPATSVAEVQDFIEKINRSIAENKSMYWVADWNGRLAGTICLWNFSSQPFKAEVGFELHPNYQGKGLMQEALSAVLNFGFEGFSLETIEGYVHIQNAPSIRLLEKNGFQKIETREAEAAVIYARNRII
ncbi:MAG: GNAT family N-acetyltransferase [Saprospiraceae bacterium]|nr:GNAT family N-acetyltransferase [Lewinellaceae bacterium]